MKNVSKLMYEAVAKDGFCVQADKRKMGHKRESMFLDIETIIRPTIHMRSVFDECDEDYMTDLSFLDKK